MTIGQRTADHTEVVVNRDGTLGGEGDACCFEVQTLGMRFAAYGHQDNVSIDITQLLHGGLHLEGDATLLQEFTQTFGNVAVEHGQAFLEILDDSYFRTKTLEDAGKLHADDTSTNDAKTLRQGSHLQQLGRSNHTGVANIRKGQHLGAAACSDNDVFSRIAINRMGINKNTFFTN